MSEKNGWLVMRLSPGNSVQIGEHVEVAVKLKRSPKGEQALYVAIKAPKEIAIKRKKGGET